jgi:hypothetical protein
MNESLLYSQQSMVTPFNENKFGNELSIIPPDAADYNRQNSAAILKP